MNNHERADVLKNELVATASTMAVGHYKLLSLIRELEDCNAMVDPNERFASYIAWLCGMSVKLAYEHVRVARALASLPEISKLFEAGRIGWSKVRIVTRVATPESDHKYASLALHGPVHFLQDIVRLHKQVSADDSERIELRRFFTMHTDDDGMVVVRARLAADEGAILKKALEAARTAGADDNCLALTEVATAGVEKLATGDDAILHVENTDHVCAVEGHACSRATADRLICQNPHKRTASTKQVRILKQLQGGTCAFPGCTHGRFLHAHHIVHWSKGGKTTIENLVLVCSKHHRTLHEGGYSVEKRDQELVFRTPGGCELKRSPELPGASIDTWDTRHVTSKTFADFYPGEYRTDRNNREYTMQWLMEPEVPKEEILESLRRMSQVV